ncbi:response regulator transcription factor [Salinimonas marina]|uniref:Response regulator transcription factor n=1 Tax=Salinimonas marina TaxID=2785918 RepID=A0A7S9DXF6_9ALTE|nr:LytTR family DNA-binding domain-containing protein [Salinimonas marina]QPG05757.1 response regulator transcription factor [Salinimonas marina]
MLKVLIVDDERLARLELVRLLGRYDNIEVVGEAANGKEALEAVASQAIDLVFVDIKMPELNGLEFAKAVGDQVHFVFCTAYSDYAVDAYELNAFDYIVKPVSPARLDAVINKAWLTRGDTASESQPEPLPDEHGLLLKFGHEFNIVRIAEIYRFESVGNHVAVYSNAGKSYLHTTLSKVESRLNPNHYFKASRSEIVRIDQIQRLEEGMAPGTFCVYLNDGSEIEVSRRQAQHLRKAFSLES